MQFHLPSNAISSAILCVILTHGVANGSVINSTMFASKEPTNMTSRSYSGYAPAAAAAGAGYQSYNGGSLMYYSNFDTALTTLAFLSFGVFLLNMIFSFLDFGTPLGPITRQDVGKDASSDEESSIKLLQRRSIHGPSLSPAALLALSTIQQTLIDNGDGGDDDDDDRGASNTGSGQQVECAFRFFCDVNREPEMRRNLDDMFSVLTSFILTGKLKTNPKLWTTSKLHELLGNMERDGGCDELLRMCPELERQTKFV